MKRVISVFLAVLILVSSVPLPMMEVNAGTSDDYIYDLNDDGETITITHYIGKE